MHCGRAARTHFPAPYGGPFLLLYSNLLFMPLRRLRDRSEVAFRRGVVAERLVRPRLVVLAQGEISVIRELHFATLSASLIR